MAEGLGARRDFGSFLRHASLLAVLLLLPSLALAAELAGPAASAPTRTEAKVDEESLQAFGAFLPVPPSGWSASPLNLVSAKKESRVSRYYAKSGSTTFEVAILFSNATVEDYAALLADAGKAAARGFETTTIAGYPALAAIEQKTYQPDYAVIVSNSRVVAAYPGGGKPDRADMMALLSTIDFKAVAEQ